MSPNIETSNEEDDWTPIDLDEAELGRCNRCNRVTFSESELGAEDRMTQPDGNPCGGRFLNTETDS